MECIYQGKWAPKIVMLERCFAEILGVDRGDKLMYGWSGRKDSWKWGGQGARWIMGVSSINRYTVELFLDSVLFHQWGPAKIMTILICSIFTYLHVQYIKSLTFFFTSYFGNRFIQLQNEVLWNSDRSCIKIIY